MNLQHQPKSNSQQNVKNSSSRKDCFVYSMQVIFFKKKKQFILMSLLNKPENSHMQKFSYQVLRRRRGAPSPPSSGAAPGSSYSWWFCRNFLPRGGSEDPESWVGRGRSKPSCLVTVGDTPSVSPFFSCHKCNSCWHFLTWKQR